MFKGERLRKLRNNQGITQKELADKLDICNGNISRYETGIREPDLQLLIKFASYFKVTTDYLLGLTAYEGNSNTNLVKENNSPYYEISPGIHNEYLLLAKKMQEANVDPNAIELLINVLKKKV